MGATVSVGLSCRWRLYLSYCDVPSSIFLLHSLFLFSFVKCWRTAKNLHPINQPLRCSSRRPVFFERPSIVSVAQTSFCSSPPRPSIDWLVSSPTVLESPNNNMQHITNPSTEKYSSCKKRNGGEMKVEVFWFQILLS